MFPLFELVALGGIIFWILTGAVVAALVAAVDRDEPTLATFLVAGTLVFLALFTTFNPFLWMWANSGLLLLLAAAYVLIGVGWTVVKWYFFNLNIASKLRAVRDEWLKKNPRYRGYEGTRHLNADHKTMDGEEPVETLEHYEWRFVRDHREIVGYDVDSLPLKVTKHKSRIMTWLAYWPFSAAWTLLNDPLRHLYNFLYERIGGSLQAISNRVFRDIRFSAEGK